MASSPPNPREGEEGGSEFAEEAPATPPKTFVAPPAAQVPSKLQYVSLGAPGPSGIKQCFRSVKTARRVPTLPRRTPERPEPRRADRGKRHACPTCDKRFSSPGKLSQHQLSHTGELPFSCEFCDKKFNSKFKLARHNLIHNEARAFSCNVCGRTFNRKDHLTNHVRVHNPVKKMYTCERSDCRKSYTSSLSYRKHMALHSAEEGDLQCKICDETFGSQQEIVYHLKVHTGSRTVKNETDKKFTCEVCNRKFFTAKDVRRHLVVHTGRRDFLCPHCPQKFGRKDHLVRHVKNAHPDESWRSAAVGTSSDPPLEPPSEEPMLDISLQSGVVVDIWKQDIEADPLAPEGGRTRPPSEEPSILDINLQSDFDIWKQEIKPDPLALEGGRTRVPSSDIIEEIPPEMDIKVEPPDLKLETSTSPELVGFPSFYIPQYEQISTELPYLQQSSALPEQLMHSEMPLLLDPGEGPSELQSQMLGLLETEDQPRTGALPAFKQAFHTSQSPKPPPPPPPQ